MLKMTTKARGPKELAAKFQKAARHAPSAFERSMQKALILIQNSVKRNLTGGHPLHVRSGRLRNSIQREMRKRGIHLEGAVGSNLIYAPIHEYGATIYAKGPAMIFKYKGNWYHVKKVVEPKRPYIEPAFTSNRERVNQMFGRDMSGLLQREGLA